MRRAGERRRAAASLAGVAALAAVGLGLLTNLASSSVSASWLDRHVNLVWCATAAFALLTIVLAAAAALAGDGNTDESGPSSLVATPRSKNTTRQTDGPTANSIKLAGHKDSVWWAAWSPDANRIATASKDGTARIWNAATGEELHLLAAHRGPVDMVAW